MKTIRLTGKKQADYAAKLINECLDKPELWCVDIKPYKEAKTMQQLRALFGTWYNYLSNTLGETKDDLHRMHKLGNQHNEGGWLLEIYSTEPKGAIQEMWYDHYWYLYNNFCGSEFDAVKGSLLKIHENRISLAWADIDQMREYMKRIEHYYMSAGYPLPILEKFTRRYQ